MADMNRAGASAGPTGPSREREGGIRAAILAAAERLEGVSGTPRLDAELLMAEALGLTREAMLLSGLDDLAPDGFEALAERRAAGEPVAYILGRRAFWTIEVEVGPGVLIPRSDSETLIEAALAHFGEAGPARILDLGTGPGSLLLAALDQWPGAIGLGVDRSERALAYARRNARRLGLTGRAELRLGDWAQGIGDKFDLVLCNPPYVEADAALPPEIADWEPGEALFAGADGMDEYRRLAPALPALLAPRGLGCVEIGDGQAEKVSALFRAAGLLIALRRDLAGHFRCIMVTC
jgi:release factor glutamine methyltransferase